MSEVNRPVELGALIGWTRQRSLNGNVLKLQCARSVAAAKAGDVTECFLALNVRQLRALSQDLLHAADEVDGRVPKVRPSGWRSLFGGPRR